MPDGESPTVAQAPAAEDGVPMDVLLDGATPALTDIPAELAAQRQVATDETRDLEDRLEAYEDLFESEVGDTVLTRCRNIERAVGVRQLYVKFYIV